MLIPLIMAVVVVVAVELVQPAQGGGQGLGGNELGKVGEGRRRGRKTTRACVFRDRLVGPAILRLDMA